MSTDAGIAEPTCRVMGRLHVYLAFDWGDEVDLDRVGQLVSAQTRVLARRRRTPSSIKYRPAPMQLATPPIELDLAELGRTTAAGELTIFDFAAVSLGIVIPFELDCPALGRLAASLADPEPFVGAARTALEPIFRLLRPAISDAEWSEASEEYFVFQLPPGPPLPAASELVGHYANWLAGLLRLEAERLSDEEIAEALRLRMSYTADDLFIPEWSAAVLVDRDCEETLETIEFANLQLLEFRYTDGRLDERLTRAYRLIHPLSRSWLPFWQTHARPLRELGDLRIEANAVFERTSNVLKLIGDQYLARVYRLLGTRFHLDAWQKSIERSLDVVEDVYRVVSDQSATFRAEFLEIAIVVLIVLEIVMGYWRG